MAEVVEPAGSSFRVVHDIDGPKVRFGVLWFVAATAACIAARPLLAAVLAVAAGCAADQVVRLHDARATGGVLVEPVRLAAVLAAAGLPLAAAAGSDTMLGAGALGAMMVLTVAGGRGAAAILAVLPIGLAAASPVLLHRLGASAALVLLLLVAAYDAGDFLVGTGASTTWEGPAAGIAAVAVVGFAATVVAPPPLVEEGAAALTVLVALLAPLGPPLASMLIGDGVTKARFVRRLDSLLIVGPIAAYVLAAVVPELQRST